MTAKGQAITIDTGSGSLTNVRRRKTIMPPFPSHLRGYEFNFLDIEIEDTIWKYY